MERKMKLSITKSFISLFVLLGVHLTSVQAAEPSAIDIACQKEPSQITDADFKSLVNFGEALIAEQQKLTLPKDCKTTVKSQGKDSFNPYVAALETAAKQKNLDIFGAILSDFNSSNVSMEETAKAHSELLKYIKVACGQQFACVTQITKKIPTLDIHKSPIFCSLSRVADYTVQDFYKKTTPTPKYPVACLGHSILTENMGLSPMQDWYEAYKLLGQ